jgi:hypothetical protein
MNPQQSQLDKLEKQYRKNPGSRLFFPLAEAYRNNGEFEQAIELYRQGLDKHPNYISARVSLGRALMAVNKSGEARIELEQVVSSVPENLMAHKLLAEIYLTNAEIDLALKQFREILEQNPNDTEARAQIDQLSTVAIEAAAAEGSSPETTIPEVNSTDATKNIAPSEEVHFDLDDVSRVMVEKTPAERDFDLDAINGLRTSEDESVHSADSSTPPQYSDKLVDELHLFPQSSNLSPMRAETPTISEERRSENQVEVIPDFESEVPVKAVVEDVFSPNLPETSVQSELGDRRGKSELDSGFLSEEKTPAPKVAQGISGMDMSDFSAKDDLQAALPDDFQFDIPSDEPPIQKIPDPELRATEPDDQDDGLFSDTFDEQQSAEVDLDSRQKSQDLEAFMGLGEEKYLTDDIQDEVAFSESEPPRNMDDVASLEDGFFRKDEYSLEPTAEDQRDTAQGRDEAPLMEDEPQFDLFDEKVTQPSKDQEQGPGDDIFFDLGDESSESRVDINREPDVFAGEMAADAGPDSHDSGSLEDEAFDIEFDLGEEKPVSQPKTTVIKRVVPVEKERVSTPVAVAKPASETITLARLYEKQGHFADALQIYERLLFEKPSDQELAQKIVDLQTRVRAAKTSEISFDDGSEKRTPQRQLTPDQNQLYLGKLMRLHQIVLNIRTQRGLV